MIELSAFCHDCAEYIGFWHEFYRHANQGHAVTDHACPGNCQFHGACRSAP